MTRFLPGVMNDPPCGFVNEEIGRLFAYHQATKHTYQSVRAGAHYLDWKNQPNPFRIYEGAATILLAPDPGFPDTGTFAAIAALANRAGTLAQHNPSTQIEEQEKEHANEIQLDQLLLSRLLWHSMAVSAWKKVPRTNDRYSLRVNPSSGNLHPTETYLALRNVTGLDDGLYHYQANRHALELRSQGTWTRELSRVLHIPWAAESRLIVALTSIFWREAWKYRDRAYRYCCHDLGHALMSLLLAAQALGVHGGAIAHFADCRMARTLGLADSDEAPMIFLVFPSPSSAEQSPTASPASHMGAFSGTPNELSSEEIPYELLLGMHRATLLPDSSISSRHRPSDEVIDAGTVVSEQRSIATALSAIAPYPDATLAAIARRRRSALDFDPATTPMQLQEVEQLLDFATRDWRADWRGNFDGHSGLPARGVDFVTLYLYVHRVSGCDPGVYRWNRSSQTLEQLHGGNVARVAAYLSLEQTLAGNACFAVSMVADLERAAGAFGNRGYRYVFFEAGAIGQRLYLGAEALRWSATGIGAFYDDDVHRYLGFLEEKVEEGDVSVSDSLDAAEWLPQQVIYHFAVGRAVPDPRLEA